MGDHTQLAQMWYSTVSNTHWVHVIYWWYCLSSSLCVTTPIISSKFVQWIIVRVFVCSTHKWVVSKVFFVTSFGLELGNISVSLLVLDLSSYVNAIQFFLCAFLVGQATMSTCSNISNGLLVRRVDYSPPCCFCDYRVRNMLRSLLRDFCSLHKAECM